MSNIYLISSSSIRLMEDEVNKIVGNNAYETFDLNSVTLDEVIEEAAYFSLFDDSKYMVVKNASVFGDSNRGGEDKVSKKDSKLLKYLEDPNPTTVLVFTINGKIDGKKKIVKTIKDKYNYIEIPDLKVWEIYDKFSTSLKKEGYKIDKDTLYYIINNSLNNYDLVYNEILKIKLYYGIKKDIKYEDVKHIVSHVLEDNDFKFVDAVMAKKMEDAFKLLDDLYLQMVDPLRLMSKINSNVRNTLLTKKLVNTHSKQDIMNLLGLSMPFMFDKIVNIMNYYTEEELEKDLVLICDLNYKIKIGKISDKLALQLVIMQVCK